MTQHITACTALLQLFQHTCAPEFAAEPHSARHCLMQPCHAMPYQARRCHQNMCFSSRRYEVHAMLCVVFAAAGESLYVLRYDLGQKYEAHTDHCALRKGVAGTGACRCSVVSLQPGICGAQPASIWPCVKILLALCVHSAFALYWQRG